MCYSKVLCTCMRRRRLSRCNITCVMYFFVSDTIYLAFLGPCAICVFYMRTLGAYQTAALVNTCLKFLAAMNQSIKRDREMRVLHSCVCLPSQNTKIDITIPRNDSSVVPYEASDHLITKVWRVHLLQAFPSPREKPFQCQPALYPWKLFQMCPIYPALVLMRS